MPEYDRHELRHGALSVYNNLVCIYGLKNTFNIIKQVRIRLEDEKDRRKALPPSELGIDVEEEKLKDALKEENAKPDSNLSQKHFKRFKRCKKKFKTQILTKTESKSYEKKIKKKFVTKKKSQTTHTNKTKKKKVTRRVKRKT